MGQNTSGWKPDRRTKTAIGIIAGILPLIICLCIVFTQFPLVLALVNLKSEPIIVDSIQVDEMKYELSCHTTLDGPTKLILYECEEAGDVCTEVERVGLLGYSCKDDDFVLRIEQNSIILVVDDSLLFSYSP